MATLIIGNFVILVSKLEYITRLHAQKLMTDFKECTSVIAINRGGGNIMMNRAESVLSWTLVTVVFLHTSESCKPDWILYERLSVCYKLFTSPQFDWPDAKNFCIREEASLTDIYDREEQMFIKNSLLKKASGHGVWVGASDSEDYNDWRWLDNTKMDIHRFDWWEGNPNNGEVPDFFDPIFPGEDCLEISLKAEHRGQLNDYKCNKEMSFICKKKYIPTTTPPTRTAQPSSEADDKSTIPVVSVVVSLSLIALVITGIVVILRRKRKLKSSNNYYEDANVTPSANENIYKCLETNDQTKYERSGACSGANNIIIDDSSFHEYHSVCFPATQSRAVTTKSKASDIEEPGSEYQDPHSLKKY